MKKLALILSFLFTLTMASATNDTQVLIQTSLGDITVKLYGDTPKHRDNFLKLVREGYYNGVLFHRVIDKFMIQTGDPDSKNAKPGQQLGSGDPGYEIDAEILCPQHFHKRGALAAARTGDQVNPERRSSGSQFYIVTGQRYDSAQIANLEREARRRRGQEVFNQLATARQDTISAMRRNNDREGLQKLQQELSVQATRISDEQGDALTEEMRDTYMRVGGTPHLDHAYTVFGEVTSGMDVVEKIEKAQTDPSDRPLDDIKILSMKVLN